MCHVLSGPYTGWCRRKD